MGNEVGCPGCKAKQLEAEAAGDEAPLQVCAEDGGALAADAMPREEWVLPPGNQTTVLLFGMTGSGKSALGNLIAGFNAFEVGDDTTSVTNLDSVMRYEAEDGSLVLLDTIGLGDTEIDQEKVVSSIRDVALSAPNGIDVLFFVMRNSRITDDTIARLIYATEYLWGSQCLLNLYVVVTGASRYLNDEQEAKAWIDRQVEINWRFRHIFEIVGSNPNRFIFVDNPDSKSREPNWQSRQAASRLAVMRMLVLHPKDAVPPFTYAMMKRVQELTKKPWEELQEKQKQLQDRGKKLAQKRLQRRKDGSSLKRAGSTITDVDDAELLEAKKNRSNAARLMKQAMIQARDELHSEAAREVQSATLSFLRRFELGGGRGTCATATPGADAGAGGPRETCRSPQESLCQACRRMASALLLRTRSGARLAARSANGITAGSTATTSACAKNTGVRLETDATDAAEQVHSESWECVLNDILAHIGGVLQKPPEEVFRGLDTTGVGAISPLEFTQFLKTYSPGMRHQHVGGLWRRADTNCDGQLDLREFCSLFAPPLHSAASEQNGGVVAS